MASGHREIVIEGEHVMDSNRTFLIHVVGCQNATWQGSITWLEEKETRNFRSLLELIKLIDTTMDGKAGEVGLSELQASGL
jgi:hypothetical protein